MLTVTNLCGFGSGDSGPTIIPTTLNPSDKSARVTLSGGNLILTGESDGFGGCRSVASISSGKYYFEILTGKASTYGGTPPFGIANASEPLNSSGGGTYGIIAYNGNIRVDSTNVRSIDAEGDNQNWGVAVDFTNTLFWVRKNGSAWSNGDPALGTGGDSFSVFAGPYYVWASCYASSGDGIIDKITMNFGASAFTQAVPSGFIAGFGL